jgi:ATP-dependent RNA helicase SUPV3L1/SUV3
MLERLADMLRTEDSRGGFEANPDMLSITGMTLEQFAALMQGLGYNAERGERAKVKATPDAPVDAPEDTPADAAATDAASGDVAAETVVEAPAEAKEATSESAEAAEAEVDVFYTFTWGGRRQNNSRGRQQHGGRRDGHGNAGGKPGGKPRGKPKGKGKPRNEGAKQFSARPPKKEKAIDPDNPFAAALMGLKTK